jgi:nudix-type nucleoside diphosphatase (YffH/AdpP family)
MTETFLHDPFGEPELLAAILGPGALPAVRQAALPDHAPGADADGLRLALVPVAGATAPGVRLALSDAALDRVDFVMAAMEAERVRLVAGDGQPVAAYRFAGSTSVGPGQPDRDPIRHRRLVEAVREVAGHFGRRDAAEMPALLHGIGIRALARARGALSDVPVRLGTRLGAADVEPRELHYGYTQHFAVEEHVLRHRRFDGTMSEAVARSVFTSGDAVTVLPFDPGRDAVLLIEQFRAAPHARRDPRPWCLEAVAGRCDTLEPPEATARREAREEAGLELGRVERIAAYYPTPGIAAEFITAFVGEADLAAAGGLHGLAAEHEDIRALVVPLDDALAAAERGEINNAPLLLSLFWLARHRGRLAAAWRRPLDGPERSG